MEVVNADEFRLQLDRYLRSMRGSLFLYPTDTVYGLGCDACNEQLVARLREAKGNLERPFSVIAPSKAWVEQNCVVTTKAHEWLERLPGPYTLILGLKRRDAVAWNVSMGLETIGVRIPACWFAGVVERLRTPIVTTSANLVGGDVMQTLEDLHPRVRKAVDYAFYDGPINGRPSTLVFLESEAVRVQER